MWQILKVYLIAFEVILANFLARLAFLSAICFFGELLLFIGGEISPDIFFNYFIGNVICTTIFILLALFFDENIFEIISF